MKNIKLLLSILSIISILAITGCAKDSNPSEAPIDDSLVSAPAESSNEADETSDVTNGTAADTPVYEPNVQAQPTFDYSAGLNDDGHLQNVVATDFTELPDYMNIIIATDVHTISDDAVNTEIDNIAAYFASPTQVTDRAILDGDTINIDYVGSVDGVEFDGGSTGGNGAEVTIGVTSFIDDFLAQLIGHTPGESFDIEVTFPEAYGKEELNGKDAIFAITVNYISEMVTPDITDEFVAAQLSADYLWNTVDEMKAGIKSELQDLSLNNYIYSYLIDSSTLTSMPEEAMTYQQNAMLNYYTGLAGQYGVTLDEYIASLEGVSSMDDLYEISKEDLTIEAKFALITQSIAEEANIIITEVAIAEYFLEYMGTSDYTPYIDQYGLGYVKNSILQDAVFELLRTNATLE